MSTAVRGTRPGATSHLGKCPSIQIAADGIAVALLAIMRSLSVVELARVAGGGTVLHATVSPEDVMAAAGLVKFRGMWVFKEKLPAWEAYYGKE